MVINDRNHTSPQLKPLSEYAFLKREEEEKPKKTDEETNKDPNLLTYFQVAYNLRVTVETISRWVAQGRLKQVKQKDQNYIHKQSIEALLASFDTV